MTFLSTNFCPELNLELVRDKNKIDNILYLFELGFQWEIAPPKSSKEIIT